MKVRKPPFTVDVAWFDEQLFNARISLRAIARRGNLSATNLCRIINGKYPLSLTAAIVLADALNVPIEEIVKRSGFPLPGPKEPKTKKTIQQGLISNSRLKQTRSRRRAAKATHV